MSPASHIVSLIEAATGPGAELDLEIGYHLGWRTAVDGHIYIPSTDVRRQWWRKPDGRSHHGLPRWTESVDDALTLIPPAYGYSFGYLPETKGLFYGAIIFRDTISGNKLDQLGIAEHASSLALAICLAAIRAWDTLASAS